MGRRLPPKPIGYLESNVGGQNQWIKTVLVRDDGTYRITVEKAAVVARNAKTGEKLQQLKLEDLE
jgi:hypothetical protein